MLQSVRLLSWPCLRYPKQQQQNDEARGLLCCLPLRGQRSARLPAKYQETFRLTRSQLCFACSLAVHQGSRKPSSTRMYQLL
ncbi:hypothetical protein XANCAGTX0491_002194 [Xanthoria calcicola]